MPTNSRNSTTFHLFDRQDFILLINLDFLNSVICLQNYLFTNKLILSFSQPSISQFWKWKKINRKCVKNLKLFCAAISISTWSTSSRTEIERELTNQERYCGFISRFKYSYFWLHVLITKRRAKKIIHKWSPSSVCLSFSLSFWRKSMCFSCSHVHTPPPHQLSLQEEQLLQDSTKTTFLVALTPFHAFFFFCEEMKANKMTSTTTRLNKKLFQKCFLLAAKCHGWSSVIAFILDEFTHAYFF